MNWLYYITEANLYLGVFYLAYCLFLTKETYYQLTRAYLLFACVVSFILPVLQIGALKPVEAAVATVAYTLPEYTAPQEYIPVATAPVVIERHLTVADYLVYAYFIGAGIVFLMLLLKLFTLFKLFNKAKRVAQDKHKLVYLPETNVAFSFFNYLFIGTNASGLDTIIRHELVHIRQKHSVDIIFLELLKAVSWFNPFIYLLQNSLKTVHEYIADEQTAAYETDALTYSSFLVNNAYGAGGSSITHSFFNYNLLKKRIVMLNQKRSGNLARLKYLVAVPVCAGLLCVSTLAFSKTYGWVDIDPAKPVNIEVPSLPIVNNDVPPLPTIASDGYEKLITYLSKNMRYHEALIKPANVVVVINFNVNANHKIADAKISRSGGSAFDALAMVALKSYKGKVNAKSGNRNIVFDFYANNTTPAEMAIVNGNLENRAGLVVILPNRQGGPGPVKFPPPVAKPEKIGQVKFAPPVVKPGDDPAGPVTPSGYKQGYESLTRFFTITSVFMGGISYYQSSGFAKGPTIGDAVVVVGFNVDKEGTISNVKLVKKSNSVMDDATVSAFRSYNGIVTDKPGFHTYLVHISTHGHTEDEDAVTCKKYGYDNHYTIAIAGTRSNSRAPDNATIVDGPHAVFQEFAKYISQNVKYPAADRQERIGGRVITLFAVDAYGNLQYAKVVRAPSEAMSNEVMRVLKKWPRFSWFKPGVQYALPVSYTLGYEDSTTPILEVKTRPNVPTSIYNPNVVDIPDNPAGSLTLNDVIIRGYLILTISDAEKTDLQQLGKYISANVKYPAADRQETIGGRVLTLLSVDAEHNLQYAKVVRTPSAAMGNEVIRVLKRRMKFDELKPGVQYTLPISFTLGYEDSSEIIDLKSRSTGTVDIYNPNAVDIQINQPGSLSISDVVIRGYIKK